MHGVERGWVLAGLALGVGVGVVALVTRRPRVQPGSRVLLIGDSLAVGLGPYLKQLATDSQAPYVGSGVPGSRIDQWTRSQWLLQTLNEFRPDIVLVSLGTNDAYMRFDDSSRELQLAAQRRLLALLEESGAQVVWILPPELDPYMGKRPDDEFVARLSDAPDHVFDSAALEIPRGPDGLHPTMRGYGGWAGSIWQWLT